jgi:hypothetical protein
LRRVLQATRGVPVANTGVSLITINGLPLSNQLPATPTTPAIDSSAAASTAVVSTSNIKTPAQELVEKYYTQLIEGGADAKSASLHATALASQLTLNPSDLDCARQSLRFFDNQMWFTEDQTIMILKSLSDAPQNRRRAVFEQVHYICLTSSMNYSPCLLIRVL